MKTVSDTVASYIMACKADKRAPRTLKDYDRVLKPFAAWCGGEGFNVVSLDRDAVRYYVVLLRERGWSENTVNLYIRYIRAFLNWLHNEDLTEGNLSRAIKAPKKIVKVERLPTVLEVCRLLDACRGDSFARRDRALLLTFMDTGLRIGEMVLLRRGDLRFEEKSKWIQVYAPKTETWRFAFLGGATTAALKMYLETRHDKNPALWLGRRGPLTTRGIYYTVRKRVKAAGLDTTQIHPHLFRKLFATAWMRNGGDETRLMNLGGWASPEMLKIYVQLSEQEDLAAAHAMFGPVDHMLGV